MSRLGWTNQNTRCGVGISRELATEIFVINEVGIGYSLSYERTLVELRVKGSQHESRMEGRLPERYIDYSLNGLKRTSLKGKYNTRNIWEWTSNMHRKNVFNNQKAHKWG